MAKYKHKVCPLLKAEGKFICSEFVLGIPICPLPDYCLLERAGKALTSDLQILEEAVNKIKEMKL